MHTLLHKSKCLVAIGWLAALSVSVLGCSLSSGNRSVADLRSAIDRRDFAEADKIWGQGIPTSSRDPFVQFMHFKDCLKSTTGVKVTAWKIVPLSVIDGKKRYAGLIDVEQSSGLLQGFGVGVEWQGERWLLKENAHLPSFVKACVNK